MGRRGDASAIMPRNAMVFARARDIARKMVAYRDSASCAIERPSPHECFAAFTKAIRRGLLRAPTPAIEELEAITTAVRAKLVGEVRQTSFQHRDQSLDGAYVFDGVSSPRLGLRLLYHAVRHFRPRRCVELGSAFGAATGAIAMGLRDNGAGAICGIEYEPWRAELANSIVRSILPEDAISGVRVGRAEEEVPAVAAELGSIDFAFVDAVHKYDDTMGYHELLISHCAAGALAVYDDLPFSDEMERFWRDALNTRRVAGAARVARRWGVILYGSGAEPTTTRSPSTTPAAERHHPVQP